MTVYDNAKELEDHLEAFLTQDYESEYEVIVVDESSSDNTDDVLKLFKQKYSHLYTTFLPKPNKNKIRKKLALTIGVKAAKYEWVIFSDIHYFPKSNSWLKELSENLDCQSDITLGYFKKEDIRLQTFEDLNGARKHIIKAERASSDGHRGKRLRYTRGIYDFISVAGSSN